MNILYVEDDPILRYSITRELRNLRHVVHETESAEAALVLLAEHDVDVLLTDVELPGESGVVFAAAARAVRPDLRLVMCTGLNRFNQLGDPNSGLVVLRKPFSLAELTKALAGS